MMFQVLKGHSSAVTHIIVNSDKGEIISAAQDKVTLLLYFHFCTVFPFLEANEMG